MKHTNKKSAKIILTVLLATIISGISQKISGFGKDASIIRFIIFMLIGYLCYFIIGKLFFYKDNRNKK